MDKKEIKNLKKMTLLDVLDEGKKYSPENVIKAKILGKYELNIHPNISSSNMDKIFEDFGIWIQDKEIQELLGDKPVSRYLMGFIIVYQTDLLTMDEYKEHTSIMLYNLFNMLEDIYAIDEIINYINDESINKLLVRINEIVKVAKKIDASLSKKRKEKNADSK